MTGGNDQNHQPVSHPSSPERDWMIFPYPRSWEEIGSLHGKLTELILTVCLLARKFQMNQKTARVKFANAFTDGNCVTECQ
jgi:hypothetical protein